MGWVVGPLLAGELSSAGGFGTPFYVTGCLAAAMCLLLATCLPSLGELNLFVQTLALLCLLCTALQFDKHKIDRGRQQPGEQSDFSQGTPRWIRQQMRHLLSACRSC